MKEISYVGRRSPQKALVELMNLGEELDGFIVAYRTKDGETACAFANVDAQTAAYMVHLINWSIYEHMELRTETRP